MEHITKGFACDFSGIRMVLDCANGASYRIAPKFFREAGADVVVIGHEPDGKNINDGYGSTCLDKLSDHVLSEKADIGIAFDGDADRCLAVDNEGRIIDGDKILHLVGAKLKQEGRLNKDTVVVTVMSNIGLDIALKDCGCKSVKTNVGDRYVLEEMLKEGYNLGGEQSGHVILLDHNTTGDGLLTAVSLLTILKEETRTSAELSSLMTSYPQVLGNAKVTNQTKNDYLTDEIIQKRSSSFPISSLPTIPYVAFNLSLVIYFFNGSKKLSLEIIYPTPPDGKKP